MSAFEAVRAFAQGWGEGRYTANGGLIIINGLSNIKIQEVIDRIRYLKRLVGMQELWTNFPGKGDGRLGMVLRGDRKTKYIYRRIVGRSHRGKNEKWD